MKLNLGPAFLRFYANGNWTHLELGIATCPHGGLARRESAIQLGFRSDHALEVFSIENSADRFIAPDGAITYGRLCIQGSRRYALSAEQIYSARLFDRALKVARDRADRELQQQLANAAVPPIDLGGAMKASA